MTESERPRPDPLRGVTNPSCADLERMAIRLRESAVTLSAWRLAITCDEGTGAIVLVETPGGGSLFRGEGLFLGWAQERLEAAYKRLLPGGGDSGPDVVQGG
jgi:hypothetical protein